MKPTLVQRLYDGPIDIVGDVHGEIEPLRSLMMHLGYSQDGVHCDGRRLVFVGDLTDRGPDSPAVVNLVKTMIDSGRAQCVLGNHDLNLLLDHRKHDNGWFYGEPFFADDAVVPQALADESVRETVLGLFRDLPVALQRDDLCIVHACWNDEMIDDAKHAHDAVALYHRHHELIEASFPGLDLDGVAKGLKHQNENPIKKLTSGPEERIDKPIESSGKLRFEKRVQWWKDYQGKFCVFGHYSIPYGEPRGSESAFCVDYGVGKRWQERRSGTTAGFRLKLGALRWPERKIVFDDGTSELV
ncbi:MAG: metallophosphoesterase [Planctomycetales bacterium]|nr:metallophosphoesterase [Planctomycetales bacterium]